MNEREMKILICSPSSFTKAKGGAKVFVEAAEGFRSLGLTCDLIGPEDIQKESSGGSEKYHKALRRYLQERAAEYDVVEYSHHSLPYPRSDFPSGPLFVARSVLLLHHRMDGILPSAWRGLLWLGVRRVAEVVQRLISHDSSDPETKVPYESLVRLLKKRVGAALSADGLSREVQSEVQRTVKEADLVNVCNAYDRARLLSAGLPEEKIHVFPFGMDDERRGQFEKYGAKDGGKPIVAFVGTFDIRKGCLDFPDLMQRVSDAVPEVRFRLLGTRGWLADEHEVLACFPRTLRSRVEVVPAFDPVELPKRLADASIGVFPSYFEGFPFSVLEMLAASLPVIAYDAPGPPEMVPSDWLVSPGDTAAMSKKVVNLLRSPELRSEASREARSRAAQFRWDEIAERTASAYQEAIDRCATSPSLS
ncbi:glycosyltransferase family 4 protein [Salinibacter ruber]|uniref:Glycosyltransferase involved in cell wall biosynthesis n=1 Tax=Salinibacter ruber TaxID=146919 RepID=A0A9X2UBE5_9BACT|nr:glycosyltransferase family 4 protein [Salinibacter ruber]MCS3953201.1 glycosyltransferase involved in cell wall biosynthesis [Salinibacter ruber]